MQVHTVVTNAVRKHFNTQSETAAGESRPIIDVIKRVDVLASSLTLTLKSADTADAEQSISIPWSKPTHICKREILGHQSKQNIRPIRTEARSRLLKGIAQGQRWLDALVNKDANDIASLATQHDLSEKTVRSMITLAFLAPDIVQAIIDGKLPRGLGISQMTDLPADWTEQRRQLGIG
jgi:site-specific DNA recombinase